MTKKESCGDCRYFELKDEHEVSGICCIRAPQAAVLLTGRPLDCWPEVHSDKWCGEFEPIALSRAQQPDTVTEEMVEAMSRAHSPELWAKIDKFADDDDWNGSTSTNARNMAMRDMRAALSHQQQGDVKLIGRLRDIADALASECHPRSTVEAITEAADALSRAPLIPVDPVNPYNHEDRQRLHDAAHTPQPDTVTEAQVAILMNGLEPEGTDAGWSAEGIKRALEEKHSGDCTKEPWTCTRCLVEHHRKALAAALGAK